MYIIKHKTQELYLSKNVRDSHWRINDNISKCRTWNGKPGGLLRKLISDYNRSFDTIGFLYWSRMSSFRDIQYSPEDFEIREVFLVLI